MGGSGVLVSRDLLFVSKVTGTAEALGLRVGTAAGRTKVVELLTAGGVGLLLVDLAAGDLASPEAIGAYRAAEPGARIVAFGSHVDTEALRAAEAAGCDEVMSRSRFVKELPELLRRHLGGG